MASTNWQKGSNKEQIINLLISHKGMTCHQLEADYGFRRPQGSLQALEEKDGVWFDKHLDGGGEVVWRLHGDHVQFLPDHLRDIKIFGLEIRCSTKPEDSKIKDGLQVMLHGNSQDAFTGMTAAKKDALSRDLLEVVRNHLGHLLPETGVEARAIECGDLHVDPVVAAIDAIWQAE